MAGGHDSAGGLRWLLTYADMITLLTVFFVVLYSMAKGDMGKFQILAETFDRAFQVGTFRGFDPTAKEGVSAAPGNVRIEDLGFLLQRVSELGRDLGMPEAVRVGKRREGTVLSLSGHLLFASGTAELRPEGRQVLALVADVLRPLPNHLRIEGHSDSIPFSSPRYRSNWDLSTARALAVLDFLRTEGRLPPDQLSYAAFGAYRPIASNDTREGRAINRRADIVILDLPQRLGGGWPQIAPLLAPVLAPTLDPTTPASR